MGVSRIHHTKISVSDMERSLHFYRDLLGFELLYDVERSNLESYDTLMGYRDMKLRIAMLQCGGPESMIGLVQYLNPPIQEGDLEPNVGGFTTFALVVEDVKSEYARLSGAGVASISPPVDIVRDGKVAARAVYVFDPDGLRIELYELPE